MPTVTGASLYCPLQPAYALIRSSHVAEHYVLESKSVKIMDTLVQPQIYYRFYSRQDSKFKKDSKKKKKKYCTETC